MARRRGVPLVRLLADEFGTVPRRSVECSVLLSGSDPDSVAREGGERHLDGFRTFKLKVGASGPERDEARLRVLRDAVGRSARIRLDANGAWKPNEALRLLERWAHYEIEFVEQPVPAHDLDGLRWVRERSAVAVAADEALLQTDGLQRVLTEHAADIVVLKPTLLGGPSTTAAIACAARRQGLDVVVTSALEGSVGITAAVHLAASLPAPSLPAGLATTDRLVGDVTCSPSTRMGRLTVGSAAGLGLVIEPSRRFAAASGPTWEVRAA
ncbi:MAG: mandelate racemase/muconate lactonizing enzyme family protein [Planctomycetota bacterium]